MIRPLIRKWFEGGKRGETLPMRNRRNIVLTGPPRSGTTLSCYLLNKAPNTVGLNEPMRPRRLARYMPDHEAVCDEIERYFQQARTKIETEKVAVSKHVGGKMSYETYTEKTGERKTLVEKGEVPVDKELDSGFYLVMKHPGIFTALLPALVEHFPCYAIVRNPVAVLASGQSVRESAAAAPRKTPRRNALGLLSEDYNREMASLSGDELERQLHKLSWAFERYKRCLPGKHIIRYEDVVESSGRELSAIVPTARELDEPLSSRNLNPLYDRRYMMEVGERLLESGGAYWHFYSRNEIEELLELISS